MFRFWRRLVRKLNFNKYFNGLIWIIRNNCNQEVISNTENHKCKQLGKEIKLNFIQNTANYNLGQYVPQAFRYYSLECAWPIGCSIKILCGNLIPQ